MRDLNFVVVANESVKYVSDYFWGTNPFNVTVNHIFSVGNSFFLYHYCGNYTSTVRFLSEISQEEFLKEKEEMLGKHSWIPLNESISDDTTKYSLSHKNDVELNFSLDIEKVSLMEGSLNPIRELFETAQAEERARVAAEEAEKAASRKSYAQRCGVISRKYGIPFANVLRMGDNEEEAQNHKDSIKVALVEIGRMSKKDREYWSWELSCGRARKKSALQRLGVYTGNGDVNHMDFEILFKAFYK